MRPAESIFNRSLEKVALPSGLLSWTFGASFSQGSEKVARPCGLLSFTVGLVLNQSLEKVARPCGLLSFTVGLVLQGCKLGEFRLHLGGACWRIPGKDYADFTEHGEEIPGSEEYHAACRQCFPNGLPSSSDGSSVTSDADST